MKNIILIVALIATGLMQSTFAQDTTKQSLQMLITDYLNLKNELTKDNHHAAVTAATILSDDLKNLRMEIFSADQNNPPESDLQQFYDLLTTDAANIFNTTDISKQREQFKDLSSNFYGLLKELKINSTDLFYQYCPMADAYWISEKSKIANPYYGKKMLTCGSTKETLKAIK